MMFMFDAVIIAQLFQEFVGFMGQMYNAEQHQLAARQPTVQANYLGYESACRLYCLHPLKLSVWKIPLRNISQEILKVSYQYVVYSYQIAQCTEGDTLAH